MHSFIRLFIHSLSKFFMAVDVPFRLLVGMQLIHYFIHSGQCYLALPLFVTLEEFFESIKWLVQTAFLLSFRTLFPISNRSYLVWVKKPCSYCFCTFLSSNLGNFSERIKTTGSMILLVVGWSLHVLQASSPSYMRRQSSILMPSLFHAYHL